MNKLTIPSGTSHVFINTKNKKSFYYNENDQWYIYNKGLGEWEKVPSLELTLIPLSQYLENTNTDTLNTFVEVEDVEVSVTNFTRKQKAKDVKQEFATPPITAEDYSVIYNLFEKHSNGVPLGFVPKEENYTVYYDYDIEKWTWFSDTVCEGLTVYTTNFETVERVIKELNS